MKRLVYISFVIALASCEVIPTDQQIIPIDQSNGETTVLLTEFTGLQCVNCPLAAQQAQQLLDIYGDRLVVVAMHPASNPFTNAAAQYDYTSEAADEYYKYFGGISSTPFPTGVINFGMTDESYFIDYTQWGTVITKQMQQSPKASIDLKATINSSTRQLTIDWDATFSTAYDKTDVESMMLWLVENKVVGAQMMPDGSVNTAYEHNHILREAVNGIWGTKNIKPTTAQITIPDNYNIDNLAVVAVLLDKNREVIATKQVLPEILTDQQIILSINGIGEIIHDTTVVISEIEENIITAEPQMGIDGLLAFNGKLFVDIERENTDIDDQFCCADQCINTNNETTQELEFYVNGISNWFTHLTPQESKQYKITYTFNSHSLNPIRLTVIYSAELE